MYKLGVIGLGTRIYNWVIPAFLEVSDEIIISAVTDIDVEGTKKKMEEKPEYFTKDAKFYTDAEEMLNNEELDGVVIGTRCNTHTDLAVNVIKRGLPLFLEKPVSTTLDEVKRLQQAARDYKHRVVVSFPLRFSEIAVKVKDIIDSGEIGDVIQVEAHNDVPYGRVYYHDWYRDDTVTGGLWLQKATHDFDYLNYILGDTAKEVYATEIKKIFKGNKPAGLKCKDCPENKTCPESPYIIKNVYHDDIIGDWCCFAVDTGNQDCGNAVVTYKNGVVANYSQNFFARHKARRRGARFYGYRGTVEFDWYDNEINVYRHDSPRVDNYKYTKAGASHFGGDNRLATLFIDILSGKTDKSYLEEGIQSALLCLMAKKSSETGQKVVIE